MFVFFKSGRIDLFNKCLSNAAQRLGVCNTSGSGTDLPGQSCDVAETHGPLPQNASLFMGFAFMLTASSECDRLTNKLSSDEEEGEADGGETRRSFLYTAAAR